ncbi:MAG: protein kinase [Gemmataceae bacterium]
MKDSEHADELVFHWQQAQDNGQRITPEELCRERPELLPEVKKAIEGLQFLESMMADVQEALDPNGPRQTMANEQSSLNDNTLERSDVPTQIGRYRVLEVLARGGMGVVCRVHDPDFDRTLAVKLILTEARREPGAEQRFLAEAQITGQLQHPSIPPVHEMGHLDDGRPFFAMKLIEGQTLSTLLSERKDPSQDLLRYVSVFEQICQTVGYVHSKGVIHRDLKPLNVMVGAFGEVQVMDWGLAKKLPPTDDARPDHHRTEPERVIDPPTGENGVLEDPDRTKPRPVTGESSWTRDGSVMGTPGYMPPEQARGEIDQLDERCDVFALGAILCEILTGHPAFTGSSHPERLRPAVKDDLSDSFARLEESPADQQLKDLCKWCLAPNKCHRPNAALEVAEAFTKYQEQIQEKLRETELQKREAQIKTIEERKRRRVQMALGLVVCSLLLMVSGSGFLYQRTQAELEASKAEKRRLEDIDQVQKYYALLNAIRKRAKVRQPGWTIPNLADINKAKKLAKDENNLIDLTTEAATSLGALDLLPGRMVIEDFQAGGIAFHPNGKMLAVAHLPTGWFGRYYCTVVVIDLTSNKKPLELKYTGAACWGKPDGAVSLVFRPDGNQIAVGTRHGNVHVWNLGQPNVPPVSWKASNSGSAIEYLTYSADGKSIYTCAGNHQTRRDVPVRRWDLTHNPPKSPAQFANPSTGIPKIR